MVQKAFACAVQRYLSVLVWLPVILASPVVNIDRDQVVVQSALILTMAGASATAVIAHGLARRRATPHVALAVLAGAVVLGSTQNHNWLPIWILLAITGAAILRGWWLAGLLLAATVGAGTAAVGNDLTAPWIWSNAFTTLLSGFATATFLRLHETIADLRRTREELARRAVSDERERFSRDLHDLLGHTLSVMVVKAQAVRRLVDQDPAAARAHAEDIEQVGRDALLDVRQAVDAMRALTLTEELEGARRALDSAGIRAHLPAYDGALPAQTDQALAWVVREGATNVLRHSRAAACRFELDDSDEIVVLTVSDDGVGADTTDHGREGGLDGLRRRLVAAGGGLDVEPASDGFRLTARVPA